MPETRNPDETRSDDAEFGPYTEQTRRFIAMLPGLRTPCREPVWMADALDGIELFGLCTGERLARRRQFQAALKYAALTFAGTAPSLSTRMRALRAGLTLNCCPDLLSGPEREMLTLAWRVYFPASPNPVPSI